MRTTSVNYTGTLQFPYATTGPDAFLKEDVQKLAYAVDNHNHVAGAGLGVAGSGIKTAIDMPDWYRSTGHTTAFAAAGQGLEMFYDSSSPAGVVQSYNRGGSIFMPLKLLGSTVGLFVGGGSEALHIDSNGASAFNFPMTCNASFAVGGSSNFTGSITCGGGIVASPGGLQATSVTCTGSMTVAATFTVTGGATFNSNVAMATGTTIGWPTGGALSSATAGYVTANNFEVTGPTNLKGGVTISGNVSTPNAITAGQYNLGTGGQYFLPISVSIRYMCAAAGEHSFETLSGGYGPCRASSFTPSSARRFKTDIAPLTDPLAIVTDDRVHGVNYTELASGDRKVGFVADDWMPVEPSVVVLDGDGGVLALDYDRIGAVTFEALKAYIARTEARLAALESNAA
jgi:hypothetical protein